MVAGGAVLGAAWGAIPGLLRAFLRTNEIITSLMLNYVAINVAYYLILNSRSTWRLLTGSGAQFPQGRPLDESAFWPQLSIGGIEIPLGFVLGALCAVGLFVLYRTTRFGFEVNVIADAPDAARYAGMWCAHTDVDRAVMASVARMMPLYPNSGRCEKTGITSETTPKNGRAMMYTSG